jgi:hypothetical protein
MKRGKEEGRRCHMAEEQGMTDKKKEKGIRRKG